MELGLLILSVTYFSYFSPNILTLRIVKEVRMVMKCLRNAKMCLSLHRRVSRVSFEYSAVLKRIDAHAPSHALYLQAKGGSVKQFIFL